MAIFCATYDYDPAAADTLERIRPAHRDWLAEQPALLASGPTDDGGALLVWEGETAAEIEALLDQDPLHGVGVIRARRVAAWQVVRGRWRDQLGL